MKAEIEFRSSDEKPAPRKDGCYLHSALLFNQCDGYHHVFARFDGDDGEFMGFYDWCGTEPYTPKFFCAWAILPDTVHLHEKFAR